MSSIYINRNRLQSIDFLVIYYVNINLIQTRDAYLQVAINVYIFVRYCIVMMGLNDLNDKIKYNVIYI